MEADEEHLPKPGEMVAGKYRVEKIVGKGGMGAVLSAHHELLGQSIAIKFLLGEIAQNPEALQRFNNEARNAFKIQSEHVCRIMDVGEHKGMPFMVMEFLRGGDLSQMVEQRGALPVPEAVDYVLQALEAIAQAHAQGITHRDLKPANLFLHQRQDGSQLIKVLDFGIAKASNPFGEGGNHSLTSTKAMLGSPLYMSPEQLRSAKHVDARSDIWALGVILYELMTGAVPFNGETLGELFIAILEQPPIPMNQRRPDIPAALNDVVMRCLVRAADQRFQNVAELAEALLPFAPSRSTSSAERVAQALGKQLSPGVQAYRQQSPSYVGGAGMGPAPMGSQTGGYGPPPQQPQPQQGFANTGSGQMQLGPPPGTQPGVPQGSGQTNGAWANSGQTQTSKAPLFAVIGVLGFLVLAGGGFGIYKATHSSSGSGTTEVPSATATSTGTSTGTSTAGTGTSTGAGTTTAPTTTTTTTTTATQTAATGTGTHTHSTATTTATGTGTTKPPPSATQTATAPVTATATTPTATSTKTAPPPAKKGPGEVCATAGDCASGKCYPKDPFDSSKGNVCK